MGKKIEIVFVSSDRDDNSYNEYYAKMPWLALPYENKVVKVIIIHLHTGIITK